LPAGPGPASGWRRWRRCSPPALALALGFCAAAGGGCAAGLLGPAAGLLSLGYAVPGTVLAVGVLAPVGLLQSAWPEAPAAALVTGTVFGVMAAYLSRFSAVALQSVQAGYARISTNVDETARLLGAGRWRCSAGCTCRCSSVRRSPPGCWSSST
jgi:iron(III) transport system permease protein